MAPPADRTKRRRRRRTDEVTAPKWVYVRTYVATAVLTVAFALIAYKAYGLQIEQGDRYRRIAQRQHLRTVELPAPRGSIYDINGRELAVTANASSVFANPRDVSDVVATAETLAETLSLDVREVEAKLASRRYFVWIKRQITTKEASDLRSVSLRGIHLTPEPRRYYPNRSLAGTVLGFAGVDGKGLDGVELTMDQLLTGHRAKLRAVRDAAGGIMMADGMTAAQPGATITLTIDQSIQDICERILSTTARRFAAKAGTVVVIDVKTGRVLAMANYPNYNPNNPSDGLRIKARNRAITDAYEMGSTMKVFSISAALDAGAIKPDDEINVDGGVRVGRKVIHDTHRDKVLTITGVIKRSSNVGAVKIAQKLGRKRLAAALRKYGFGRKSGIELPGERAGVLRPPETWADIELATIAFGHGMTATTLQLAAGLAAIGNGGVYHKPRIVASVREGHRLVYKSEVEGRRVMRADTAAIMRRMMAAVFDKGKDGGTARSVNVRGYRAGGKTGTAHKVDPETHSYSNELYLSSFAGLAPINDPKIAVVVVIDEPDADHHFGAVVAAPAFARIASETLRYLGVPPGLPDSINRIPPQFRPRSPTDGQDDSGNDAATDGDPPVSAESPSAQRSDKNTIRIPDFRGMTMAKALDVARKARIDLRVRGTGTAISQSVQPGWVPERRPIRVQFAATRP